jgi:hypothetical protein
MKVHDITSKEGLLEALRENKKKYVLPAENVVPLKSSPEEQIFDYLFEQYEVFIGDCFEEEHLKAMAWKVANEKDHN